MKVKNVILKKKTAAKCASTFKAHILSVIHNYIFMLLILSNLFGSSILLLYLLEMFYENWKEEEEKNFDTHLLYTFIFLVLSFFFLL